MALTIYKGYVSTNGKKSTMPFKDKRSDELLTLEVFKHDKYIIFTKYQNEDDDFCSYGERKEE